MGGVGQGQATKDVILQLADQLEAGLKQEAIPLVVDFYFSNKAFAFRVDGSTNLLQQREQTTFLLLDRVQLVHAQMSNRVTFPDDKIIEF